MKYLYLIVLLIGSTLYSFAQSEDCPQGDDCIKCISTNPENPYHPDPLAPPYKLNTFDWMKPNYPARSCAGSINDNLEYFTSPFYQTNNSPTSPIQEGSDSDFYPADGWELVKRDMGLLMRAGQMDSEYANDLENNLRNYLNDGCVYYLMLYNRHSSTLRVIASLNIFDTEQVVEISLWQLNNDDNATAPWISNSGIFSQLSNQITALDQLTTIERVNSPVYFPDQCGRFFYADFPMAYDPCVCFFESQVNVAFTAIEESQFDATGRSTGVAQDIKTAWQGGYDPQEFLASFARDVTNPNYTPGAYIHKEASKIYEKEMLLAEQQGKSFLAGALYVLATAAKVGTILATKGTATPVVTASSATKAAAKGLTIKKAMKIAAPVFNFLSGQLSKNKPAKISPMVIESEIVLSGNITTENTLECAQINMATPGSRNADDLAECCEPGGIPDRPTYNDPLGVFGMLKTPIVYVSPNHKLGEVIELGGPCSHDEPAQTMAGVRHYQVSFSGDLDYAFNPRAQVNTNNTEILVALEIIRPDLSSFELVNMEKLPFAGQTSTGYITPYLPISCLGELTAELKYDPYRQYPDCNSILYGDSDILNTEMYLRVLINYEFNAIGTDGEAITDFKEYRYSVDKKSTSIPSGTFPAGLAEITPNNLEFDQPTTFTGTGIITHYAWYDININADLSVGAGVQKVRLIAGDAINVSPDAVISPNIELIIGYPFECGPQPTPWTSGEIGGFCNSESYRAKESIFENTRIASPPSESKIIPNLLQVFPSPFKDEFKVRFSVEEQENVSITILDMSGRMVSEPLKGASFETGTHDINLSGTSLKPGAYIVRLEAGGKIHHAKVMKQ
ncbi:MAG: T9SS type A sorting domain-containing protein [Bacteroidia bacterium]